ncbi:MAG: single-stranded DNA-binding protein [candidate division Zixibacteria bacterium]|nr:single-stranded DNA-binding protein [candidate division Zixibacteria bacterium]
MASLNRVELIGNLGADPELKYTPSQQAVATFRIATTRKWKGKDGTDQEDTQWHNIKCWGRWAEVAKQSLTKGRQVYVEGRLETRSYDDKDGNRKWFTEVVAQYFMVGARRGESDTGEGMAAPESANQAYPQPSTSMAQDDDLPF